MKRFKLIRDEYGDIVKYELTNNICIEREVANNLSCTSSKYYLIYNGKIIKESGYGTGYSLKDLKNIAINL
jgi:hypothetical protein